MIPMEIIGLEKVTAAASDISGAAPEVIGAGIGISVAFFGAKFLWRKLRSLAS